MRAATNDEGISSLLSMAIVTLDDFILPNPGNDGGSSISNELLLSDTTSELSHYPFWNAVGARCAVLCLCFSESSSIFFLNWFHTRLYILL